VSDLYFLCALSVETLLLGLGLLVCSLCRWRPRTPVVGAVLLLPAAGSAAARLPVAAWLPPLILCGVWAAGSVLGSATVGRLASALLSGIRKPAFQGLLLATVGVAGLTALVRHVDQDVRESDRVLAEMEFEITPPNLTEAPRSPAYTDRGRQILLQISAGEKGSLQLPLLSREKSVVKDQPRGLLRLADPSPDYNCHGYVFTGGLFCIRGRDVAVILEDNDYRVVERPGTQDLVVYRDDAGDIIHTAVVLSVLADGTVLVESKWGALGRYVHTISENIYALRWNCYRSRRNGHLLRGVGDQASTSPGLQAKL
jgi:hypothetical protein